MDIREVKDSANGEIVLYQPNDFIKIEVRLDSEKDTVWLTQQQIADLFCVKQPAISKHLNNIYKSGELDKDSTYSVLEYMGNDSKQRYSIAYYNLDAIISVGYRVNSANATAFRRWATSVLKEHLLQGYSINRQLIALQERTDERFINIQSQLNEQKQQVKFLVDMHRKPTDLLFSTGCVFDAWEYVAELVREAECRILLIDNYCDERTLLLLAKRQSNVACTIYTRFNEVFNADLEKYNSQYPAIVKKQLPQKEHDRFLIIDNTVYILGDSLKNLGHSMTTILKTSFTVEEILEKLKV
ncbi:MAG: virulence RhuM family protein [Bacteroidaceae bacterium]|nr:virulence RhuM family protein [Bacteroidaceae bacterium]